MMQRKKNWVNLTLCRRSFSQYGPLLDRRCPLAHFELWLLNKHWCTYKHGFSWTIRLSIDTNLSVAQSTFNRCAMPIAMQLVVGHGIVFVDCRLRLGFPPSATCLRLICPTPWLLTLLNRPFAIYRHVPV